MQVAPPVGIKEVGGVGVVSGTNFELGPGIDHFKSGGKKDKLPHYETTQMQKCEITISLRQEQRTSKRRAKNNSYSQSPILDPPYSLKSPSTERSFLAASLATFSQRTCSAQLLAESLPSHTMSSPTTKL